MSTFAERAHNAIFNVYPITPTSSVPAYNLQIFVGTDPDLICIVNNISGTNYAVFEEKLLRYQAVEDNSTWNITVMEAEGSENFYKIFGPDPDDLYVTLSSLRVFFYRQCSTTANEIHEYVGDANMVTLKLFDDIVFRVAASSVTYSATGLTVFGMTLKWSTLGFV